MGYYLSKRNESFLNEFISVLKNAKDTITIETNDPDRLLYILRNAKYFPKYSWLSNKFIFSKKPIIRASGLSPGIMCKIRDVMVSIVDGIKSIDDSADLVFIVNHLIQEKPFAVKFTNTFVTETEYEKLEAYCAVNLYKVTKSENTITIIKDS